MKMPMRFVVFIYLIIAGQLGIVDGVMGQQYEGNVIDSLNTTPMPYVNIGIVGKNIGTVSDSSGYFKIMLDSKYDADTLRFSMVGYARKDFLVSDFRKLKNSDPMKVWLKPQAIVLDEVTIQSSKEPGIVLGNKPKSKLVNAGFIYNKLGHEIGSVFRNTSGELIIDSIKLNFVKCNFDYVYFRLNVYKVEGDKIENILQKPHYISLTRNETLKCPTIDLMDHRISVKGDFLVSIELVKDLGEKGLYFYAKINDDTSLGIYRETSQSNWIYMKHKSKPVGISIQAFVH